MAMLNNQRVSQFEDQTYTLAISGSFAVPSIIHGWQRYGESFLVHPINPSLNLPYMCGSTNYGGRVSLGGIY